MSDCPPSETASTLSAGQRAASRTAASPLESGSVGSPTTNKQRLASTYDTSTCIALARKPRIGEPAARESGR
jgi:hypothetical protein